MQGGRHPFFNFGGPFGGFGGFSGFGGFDLTSSILGGHDPFDDPFFASPFQSMFGSSFFHNAGIVNPNLPGIIRREPPLPRRLRGPVIEELNSDAEKDDESRKREGRAIPGHIDHEPRPSRLSKGPIIEELNSDDEEGKEGVNENPRKHRRSTEVPFVEEPENGTPEKKRKYTPSPSLMKASPTHHIQSQPQSHSFTFQSSTVSYGGADGAFYTSSRTTRTGGDGLMFEECKEADSSSGQATHRVTRGIYDKGHSITRKLTSGGHVDAMQTLHNLDEDELIHFNKAWKGNVGKHLPLYQDQGAGARGISQRQPQNIGWALPSAERSGNIETGTSSGKKTKHHTVKGKLGSNRGTGTSGSHQG